MSTETTISVHFDSYALDPVGSGGWASGWVTVRIEILGRHTATHHLAASDLRTSFHVQPWTATVGCRHLADLLNRYEFSDADGARIQSWLCDFGRKCLALTPNGGSKDAISVPNIPFACAGFHPTVTVEDLFRSRM